MIINERDLRHQSVVEAAHRMMTAARTAPKAKGVDIIEIALVEEREDLEKLAEAMRRRSEETGFKFLLRDADNILQGEAVILIGTRRHTQGLNCGYCGYSGSSRISGAWIFRKVLNLQHENCRCNMDVPSRWLERTVRDSPVRTN